MVEDNLSAGLVHPATDMSVNGSRKSFIDKMFLPSAKTGNFSITTTMVPYFGPARAPFMETSLRFPELPLDDIPDSSNNDEDVHLPPRQSHTVAKVGGLIGYNSAEAKPRRYLLHE